MSYPTRLYAIAIAIMIGLTNQLATAAGTGEDFKGPIGLQFESLGPQFGKSIPNTLGEVHGFGIKYVELVGTYGMPPERFKTLLGEHGLEAVSCHYSYQRFRDDAEGIAREAKILGIKYAVCRSIPHDKPVDEKTIREAIVVFNRAGETLAKQGIKFGYHPHGYEFRAFGDETLFDLLMKETKPELVFYEMDIFWIVHAGKDPVKLLEKYGTRWELMHLKDMKKGTPTGLVSGQSDRSNNVVMGTGQIDIAAILRAAKKVGVKYYFLEDESASAEKQIPQSLKFLEQVKL